MYTYIFQLCFYGWEVFFFSCTINKNIGISIINQQKSISNITCIIINSLKNQSSFFLLQKHITISMLCSSCRLFFSLACLSVTSCNVNSKWVKRSWSSDRLELWDWNTCLCRCTTLLACSTCFWNCWGISSATSWTEFKSLLISYKI